MIRDNKILSLFDFIHWPVARLTFRENDSKDTKKIENNTGFEQKPRFIPRTKSRIFSILQFFIIFLRYNLLRIMKRGKRRRIRIFVEKKYLRIRLNLQFELVDSWPTICSEFPRFPGTSDDILRVRSTGCVLVTHRDRKDVKSRLCYATGSCDPFGLECCTNCTTSSTV